MVVVVANVNIVSALFPVNCSLVIVTPAALSIVTSAEEFLVNVIPVPAVNWTVELSVPEPEVIFKSTLLPSVVAFKS